MQVILKMKIQLIYLTLLIICNKSTTLFCSHQKPIPPKAVIDELAHKQSKRNLVRANLLLRQRLAREESQTELKPNDLRPASPDLEAGTGLELPTTSSIHSTPSMRRRTLSMHSDDQLAGSVDGLHGTVADFLALQNTQLLRQKAADDERDRFQ